MHDAKIIEFPSDGPLVRYAIEELRRAGLDRADADYGGRLARGVVEVLRAFSREGHSGHSAIATLQLVDRLARWKPLGPLTNDPGEWMEVSSAIDGLVHQSTRSPSCFSRDGGATYYDLDEPRSWWRVLLGVDRKTHRTAPKAVRP